MPPRKMTLKEWAKARDWARAQLEAELRPGDRLRTIPDRMVDHALAIAHPDRDLTDLATWKDAAESAIARYGLEFHEADRRLRVRCAVTGEELPQLVELRGGDVPGMKDVT